MKHTFWKIAALLLVLCMLLPLAACGGEEAPKQDAKPEDVFNALLNKVTYASKLTDYSDSAATTYMGLPEGATVTMYVGNALYADELTWIKLAQESDMEYAVKIVDKHLDELYDQYLSYHPDEVPKIESALIWKSGANIILCVTDDYDNAKALMDNPAASVTQSGTDEGKEETTAPSADDPTEPVVVPPETEPIPTYPEDVELNANGYPAITSEYTWRDAGNCMIVGNMAYEYYGYSDDAAKNYAKLVSATADALNGQTNVYCLVIPTSVGVVFPDNLAEQYKGYEDQGARLEQIYGYMSDTVIPVNIFEKLMQHRNEYLYYRTDWHWSAIGAYYGYEKFCEVKGIAPYTMDDRIERVYEGYKGPFASKDSALSATPDTVYAYEPYFYEDVSMVYTDTNGNKIAWPVIADGDSYASSGKYLIFAAGDQPMAEFTNPKVTDGSVAIVVKESFGNAMMAYFPDHYSTVYEIDYRHWSGDLVQFAREVGADDIIFANNIGMVRSSLLIGKLDNIIP